MNCFSLRVFASSLGAFGATLAPVLAQAPVAVEVAVEKAARQNILLITADDLGREIPLYGDHTVATPHLDALGAQGTVFQKGYVTQASCSPSRASLLTGLFPTQHGQWGLAYPNSGYNLKTEVSTLPERLKTAGYTTGIMGKLHIAPQSKFPFDWERSNDYGGPPTIDTTDVLKVANEADTFFAGAKTQEKPFFLMVNYYDPHRVWRHVRGGLPAKPLGWRDVKPLPFQKADSPALREQIAAYYNAISRLDTGIGALLRVLRNQGLDENTLVIFVGDNGAPFARAKVSNYEAGVAVPFIVKSPGANAVRTTDKLVSTVDLFPTMLEAARLPVPDGLPGRSLAGAMNDAQTPWREFVFTQHTAHTHWNYNPTRTVSDGRYKLILRLEPSLPNPATNGEGDGAVPLALAQFGAPSPERAAWERFVSPPPIEFFDLQSDPFEWNNLAGQTATQAHQKRLEQALQSWRESLRDPFLDAEFLRAQSLQHAQIREKIGPTIAGFDKRQNDQALPEDSPLHAP